MGMRALDFAIFVSTSTLYIYFDSVHTLLHELFGSKDNSAFLQILSQSQLRRRSSIHLGMCDI